MSLNLKVKRSLTIFTNKTAYIFVCGLVFLYLCLFPLAKAQETSAVNLNTDNKQTAYEWLLHLSQQLHQLNFEMSFVVHIPGKETQPYLWRHAVMDDNTRIEQLSLLNGPGMEQIRYNQVVSVFEPGFAPYSTVSAAIDGPIPWMLLHHPTLVKAAYEFVLVGRNRISGKAAQQLRIISRDKTRFNYHLWLDEETGLLLKLNMYDLDNKLIKQIQATQLTIDDDVKLAFSSVQPENLPQVVNMKNAPPRQHKWRVSFMPEGMQRVKQDVHRLAITNQIVEYSMLSDGLIDVSVYVQPALDIFQQDVSLRQDTNTILSRTNGRVQVTIIGEIPLTTADKMANSIVLVN